MLARRVTTHSYNLQLSRQTLSFLCSCIPSSSSQPSSEIIRNVNHMDTQELSFFMLFHSFYDFRGKNKKRFLPDCGQNTYLLIVIEHSSNNRLWFRWALSQRAIVGVSLILKACFCPVFPVVRGLIDCLLVFRHHHHPLGWKRFFILSFRRFYCNAKININLLPQCY